MRVLTWNIMTPVLPPFRHHGQWERMAHLTSFLKPLELDVVLFNELIPKPMLAYITKEMATIGFHHVSKPLEDHLTEYGGVVIFSKIRMLNQFNLLFGEDCATSDCLAAKGCVLVRLENNVMIAATHLQSMVNNDHIRHVQLEKMKNLIDNLPESQPLIVAGDFNTGDKHYLLNILGVNELEKQHDSLEYTMDPANNPFVGLDDPDDYKSQEWPNGCFQEQLNSKRCPCCKPQVYDWIFVRNAEGSFRILDGKIQEELECAYTFGHTVKTNYVSDHNPVLAEIAFDATFLAMHVPQQSSQGNTSQTVLFSILIVCLILILLSVFGVTHFLLGRKSSTAFLRKPNVT